ncbi:MAG TPA: LAGLIDADG family homing endonuclease [Gammaproteobacteria bacterium]|nr:LAGLIDADG family homing endonuclease [Gammaproteobacteria bacterium]
MADYKSTQQLSKVDAAYIAGLIDGEGTVALSRKHAKDNRQLCISISNTESALLEYALQTIGTGKITAKRTVSDKHTPSFVYAIYNRQALSLLEQITPYLRTYKRERACLILRDYIRLTPRNGKYTDALKGERLKFETAVQNTKPNLSDYS